MKTTDTETTDFEAPTCDETPAQRVRLHRHGCVERRRNTPDPAEVVSLRALAGLRPIPTMHAVVGSCLSGRLTQGPAVSVADHHHPLRLDMLTMTRSVYVQVRCAVIALWSGPYARYAHQIEPASTKLDSILPTSSAQDFQSRSGTPPGTGGPFGAAPVAGAPHPPALPAR